LREMKTVTLGALVVLLLFSVFVGSVFGSGSGYSEAIPILGTTGAPALASPSLFTGVITVLYADGSPVVLGSDQVNLSLCSTNSAINPGANTGNCVSVHSTLKQTAPGTYSYSFTPPALAGIVTIYISASGLADDNGRVFPSVDTQIGTYSSPSNTSSVPASQTQPGNPVPQQATNTSPFTRQAVTPQPTRQSPIFTITLALVVILMGTAGILILPRRK